MILVAAKLNKATPFNIIILNILLHDLCFVFKRNCMKMISKKGQRFNKGIGVFIFQNTPLHLVGIDSI